LNLAVVPGSGRCYAQIGSQTALPLPDVVLPTALELFALGSDILAFAVFLVVSVIALVKRTVIPHKFAQTLELALLERTFVFSVFQSQLAEAIEVVVFEETIVDDPVWKFINPLSMLLSIQNLSSVVRALFPGVLSLATGKIVQPLPVVLIFLVLVDQPASSLRCVVSYLALVVATSAEDIPSFAVGIAVHYCALVVASVFKVDLAETMGLVVFPGTSVYLA